MSMICLRNLPIVYSMARVKKDMKTLINDDYVAAEFVLRKDKLRKNCYLSLPKGLSPAAVVERINNGYVPHIVYKAFISKGPPNKKQGPRPKSDFKPHSRELKVHNKVVEPELILRLAHVDILTEMQLKYPGLYNISAKRDHELLITLAEIIKNRICSLFKKNRQSRRNFHQMTMVYRLSHPHFTDFQLILRTMQHLEDSAGLPRTQISEEALSDVLNRRTVLENIPSPNVETACRKYAARIANEVMEHIDDLDVKENNENYTKEQIARNNVRRELKKMACYVPQMIKWAIEKHFVVKNAATVKMMLYGEPELPPVEKVEKFLRGFQVPRTFKMPRLFNALRFDLPPAQFHRLMNLDGISYGGAKLVMRPAILPMYDFSNKKPKVDKLKKKRDQLIDANVCKIK